MARQRRCIWALVSLVVVLVYEWPLVYDVLRTAHGVSDSRLLAEASLEAAMDSVHKSMRILLEDHDWTDSASSRTSDRQRTKVELAQASLDSFLFHAPRNGGLHVFNTNHSHLSPGTDEDTSFDLCPSLAGTRTTMVGGAHIYALHTHLLQHREHVEGQPFPCLGRKFCTHHHICLPPPLDHASSSRKEKPRYVKPPTTQALLETESALVNYIVSDTLFAARDETSWEYTMPFLDPITGVRLNQGFWLAAARRANILILGRGPLSPSGSTYTGNWSFLRHVPDYIEKAHETLTINVESRQEGNVSPTAPRPLEILNVAVHLTISQFLPDLFRLFQAIRQEVRPSRSKRLIWAGTWYRLPGQGIARMAFLRSRAASLSRVRGGTRSAEQLDLVISQLSAFLDADAMDNSEHEDPWTLLYNTQVYLQTMVLRDVLPRYGIVFLDLNRPRSDDVVRRGRGSFDGIVTARVERERTEVVGNTFLRGLDHVLRSLE